MISARLAILIATTAGLAGLVWLDRSGPGGPPADAPAEVNIATRGGVPDARRTAADDGAGKGPRNPLSGLRRESLKQTVERPLFAASRRPPPKRRTVARRAAPPPPKPEAKRNHFKLLGVMRGDQNMIALLSDKRSGRYFRVQSGDHIDGWRVTRIGSGHIALAHREQRITLSLPEN